MACEVGLYYVLHVAKQRNKNALLRLLPGLGESGRRRQRSASSRSRSVHKREARCPRHLGLESLRHWWGSQLSLILPGEGRAAPQALRRPREAVTRLREGGVGRSL